MITLKEIAVIHTDFPDKFGIPRQSGLVEELKSTLVFQPEYRVPEALRGLEQYSHLWLIWEFSKAVRNEWKPTVRPPRLGGNTRMGVFATRSPYRPNPLGLTCVKLDHIEHTENGPIVHILGADLRDNTPIRVSRSVRDLAYKALSVKDELAATLSREPRIEEIAAKIGVPKEDVALALDAIADPVSLYEPVYSENGDSVYVMDKVCDTANTDDSWLENIAISQAIGKLSPREKRIIMLRFFEGRTQMEVAKEISISQAQVSRLEKGALERIKKDLR